MNALDVVTRWSALWFAQTPPAAPASSSAPDAAPLRDVTSFRFLDAPPAWVIALVIVPAVALGVWLVYRRESREIPPRTRIVLGILRGLAFFMLFLFLFRPVRETQPVVVEKSVLPVLIDASASMTRKDAYVGDEVADRLAKLAGLADASRAAEMPRIDLVKTILQRPETDPSKALSAKNEVRFFSFGEELRSIETPSELVADAPSTRLGSAITDLLTDVTGRGERVTEIVVVSDGRSNSGIDPSEAAALAALDGIKVHAVGVGDPNEPRNVEIKTVRAPDVALVNDDVAFEVTLAAHGYEGKPTSLTLRQEDSSEILASREVELAGRDREQTEVLYWKPERDGDYDLVVTVEPLPGEQFTDDNARAHHLRVDPEEIKVLYVEGYPRWEYRFLMNILLRAKNVKAQCLLLDADKDFIQESTAGVPALTGFPPDKVSLFDYDVVILGDVPPFGLLPTVEQSEQALASLKEFVELGGGLIMVAGVLDNPRAYAGTPLEDVLPVVLGDADDERKLQPEDYRKPFRPKLENPLDPQEIVRLEKDVAKNRKLWEDPDVGLPPQEWYYPVRKAKGGAEVLLRHPENSNQFGKHVVLASTYYPSGRTLFVGFDSTWKWRRFYGERYTERFWRAAIRSVAINKLRRTNKRFELVTDKALYDVNEPVDLIARIRDTDFNPVHEPTWPVHLLDPDGKNLTLELSLVDADEGRFERVIRLGRDGGYQTWLEDPTGREPGRLSPKSFRVEVPRHEWENPVLAKDVLESVATTTHGAYVGLDQLPDLLKQVGGEARERPRGEPEREELWSSWPALLAFVLVLAAEWLLRKRANLV